MHENGKICTDYFLVYLFFKFCGDTKAMFNIYNNISKQDCNY